MRKPFSRRSPYGSVYFSLQSHALSHDDCGIEIASGQPLLHLDPMRSDCAILPSIVQTNCATLPLEWRSSTQTSLGQLRFPTLFAGATWIQYHPIRYSLTHNVFVIGENQSSKGPDESSPVRSAGFAYFKRRPSRRDDRWLLVLLKSPRDQEPNASIVPCPERLSIGLQGKK